MIKVILAAHGRFPEGLLSSVELIIGKQNNIHIINAYTEEVDLDDSIDSYLKEFNFEIDKLIIATDVFGGSVNQKLLTKVNLDQVHLISGVNLPLLLEVAMLSEEDLNEDKLREIIQSSKDQVMLVKDYLNTSVTDDFDF